MYVYLVNSEYAYNSTCMYSTSTCIPGSYSFVELNGTELYIILHSLALTTYLLHHLVSL